MSKLTNSKVSSNVNERNSLEIFLKFGLKIIPTILLLYTVRACSVDVVIYITAVICDVYLALWLSLLV